MVDKLVRRTVGYGVVLMSALFGRDVMAQQPQMAAATDVPAVARARVTLDVDGVPLRSALQRIAQQAGLRAIYDASLVSAAARVSVHVRQVPVDEAFQIALRGTGLSAQIRQTGHVLITSDTSQRRVVAPGTITGRVTDAGTHQPVHAAVVGLDGVERVAQTAEDGTYRIVNVSAGTHTLVVKALGYTKAALQVTVRGETDITMNVTLTPTAAPLDQVIVTGTVIPTELKAVPNAMTVITAKQLEERGITRIDQLFRGDVPGLFAQNKGSYAVFDEVTMFSRGATALSSVSTGTDSNVLSNPIKTYVDGVELADPKYLSQIDPQSIERIEILAGPQASTIYGSNAINGVMQIFTKRGTSNTPQLTVNLLSGFVQNNFSSALTPQHNHSTQLNGLEGHLSYNAGGSWDYMGPWTPGKQTTRTSVFGGTRLEYPTTIGRMIADATLRRTQTKNVQHGTLYQAGTGYRETGWYALTASPGLAQPATATLVGQTSGLTLTYTPTNWWSHEFGVGQDVSDNEIRATDRGYTSPDDTTLSFSQAHEDRQSWHYVTTFGVPIATALQATVIFGGDAWHNLASSITASSSALTGTFNGATSIARQPEHNTGGFLQAQLAVNDQWFLTYGLRAEWNPNFGADAQPNYAPRYGVAYTQQLGPVTTKVRASYGRSTRPPGPSLKVERSALEQFGAGSIILQDYGNYDFIQANPLLGPEHQQGGEGGLELYLGTRGSLVVTRYNQTVDALIAQVKVDSARSLTTTPHRIQSRDPAGYGYFYEYQYLNVGSLRNQGWELQGSMNMGPFTTKGTYSWTKSRTIGVNPRYRTFFTPNVYPQYQPGATYQFLPEHTGALGLTYTSARTEVGMTITGVGRTTNSGDNTYLRNLTDEIRLVQNRFRTYTAYYVSTNPSYAMADFTASHRMNGHLEAVVQIQNLMDRYINDYVDGYAVLGRQVKVGGRLRTR